MVDVTHKEVWSAYLLLRRAVAAGPAANAAMLQNCSGAILIVLEAVAAKMRHDAIFDFGAASHGASGTIVFDGNELGSAELCTFYDGYASTHPGFKNPYRSKDRSPPAILDAARYRWLRERPTDTIEAGGVFIGLTSETGRGGMVLTERDADAAVDAAMAREAERPA